VLSYCKWTGASALDRRYHDYEWGVPVHDDRTMFEFLMLEAMQCGLSWEIVLRKREIMRACFDNFDFVKISAYTDDDVERIMNTEGMIRSRRKIQAVVGNARCFLEITAQFGSFCSFLWSFTDNKSIVYTDHRGSGMPVCNALSMRVAAELKKKGFKYLGPVTVYSHLQGCGIINDHDYDCPCYKRIVQEHPVQFRTDEGAQY
jgi:DNA-3-methyladenine glycosylase I